MSRSVVLMGVSGCGKSTVGEILAQRSGGAYFDGDDFHPPENVEKMRSAVPLTDDDRKGWFDALGDLLTERKKLEEWTFLACSALRRRYRDQLRQADPKLRFVLLRGSFELIQARMQAREGHYMPASLLRSQFEALEEPDADENVPVVEIDRTPEEIADEVWARLSEPPPTRSR